MKLLLFSKKVEPCANHRNRICYRSLNFFLCIYMKDVSMIYDQFSFARKNFLR